MDKRKDDIGMKKKGSKLTLGAAGMFKNKVIADQNVNAPLHRKKFVPPPSGLSSNNVIGFKDESYVPQVVKKDLPLKSKPKEITMKVGTKPVEVKEVERKIPEVIPEVKPDFKPEVLVESKSENVKPAQSSLKMKNPPGGKDSIIF